MSQTKAQLIDPVDGSLVNADINASAAIAGTKISPDFGSQTLITDGISLVGLSTQLSSNAAKLQVAHTDGNADIIVHRAGNNANPPSFNFQKTRNASIGNYGTIVQDDDELGSLRWGGADGSNIAFAARIVGAVDGTPGTNDMPGRIQFHTSADGGEDLTERMRIDASGRVGIAQTPVSEKLEVSGAIRSTSASANFAAGAEAVFMDFISGNRGRIGTITGTGSARDLAFNIGNLEKMRINTSGNVGIGTTNPTSKIDIHCGNDNTGLQITSTDAGAFASYFDNTGASTIGHSGTSLVLSCDPAGSVGSSNIVFQVDSNSEKMRIDNSGRLLIGIATARANFGNNTSGVEQQIQLEGTTATKSTMSLIRNSNDANDGGIILGKTRGTSVGSNTVVQAGDDLGALNFVGADGTSLQFGAAISATVESGVGNDDMPAALKFFTNGGSTSMSERMRILANGRVHITPSSTNYTMNSNSTNLIIGSGGGAVGMTFLTAGAADGQFISFQANETLSRAEGEISYGPPTTSTTADRNNMMFRVNSSEKLRILAGGGIVFNGDTPTADNALDDYEEGTWTPTTVRWSVAESTGNQGRYTKIGNFVQISWNQSLTATNGGYNGNGQGAAIGGLPFTVADCVVVSFSNSTLWTSTLGAIDNIGNDLFYRPNKFSSAGIATDAMFNSSGVVKLTATYRTNQ